MGAIQGQRHSFQGNGAAADNVQIAVQGVRDRAARPHPLPHRGFPGRPGPQPAFDLRFRLLVELAPPVGEKLDPVVGGRVVGSGHHHPQAGAQLPDQGRHAPHRNHARVPSVHAHRMEPGVQGGGQHLPGAAGVPSDHRRPPRPGFPGRPGQTHGQVHVQFPIGQTAHPVGAEQPLRGSRLSRPAGNGKPPNVWCTGGRGGLCASRTFCAPPPGRPWSANRLSSSRGAGRGRPPTGPGRFPGTGRPPGR